MSAVEIFRMLEFQGRKIAYPVSRCVMRRFLQSLGDGDPLLNAVIGRNHEIAPLAYAKFADHRNMRALKNAHDLAFCPALARQTGDVDECAVAVHALGGFRRRQENIASDAFWRGRIGYQKSEAVTMHREPSCHVLGIGPGGQKVAGPQFDQQALIAQAIERVFESVTIFTLQAQLADKLLVGGARMRKPADMFEQALVVEMLRLLHIRNSSREALNQVKPITPFA